MKFSTALKLGRVSNLPTVWTNTLVGLAFASASVGLNWQFFALACLVFSLFYLAGMYFNDFFDSEWDKQHQVNRPIPSGEVKKSTVALMAVCFLVLATSILIFLSNNWAWSLLLASVLMVCILLYDWKHKQWPHIAPWIMGSCRLAVYLGAATLGVAINLPLTVLAISMLIYIAGITAFARSEHENSISSLWPVLLLLAPCVAAFSLGYDSTHAIFASLFALAWIVRAVIRVQSGLANSVPQAIAALLAGITLLDAAFLFALGSMPAAIFCILMFILCLLMQHWVSAT